MTYGPRATGQTTTAIGTLYSNRNAFLIVANYEHRSIIERNHPTIANRIRTVEQLASGTLRGLTNAIIVWDTEAVTALELSSFYRGKEVGKKSSSDITNARKEGYEDGFKEGKAYTEDMVEQSRARTDAELSELKNFLNQVAKTYQVDILVSPK